MDITVTIVRRPQPAIQSVIIIDCAFDSGKAVVDIDSPKLVKNILLAPHNHISILRNLRIAINA